MAQYVGRRIVPVHGGVWDKNKAYEELTIVLHAGSGDSYISRRPVPAGTAVTDEHYWMLHSLYSQQIAEAAAQMEATEKRIEKRSTDAESQMQSRVAAAENLTNSNKEELNERMDGLDKRLDANVSASTDENADYAAEVVDARVDAEGTIADSLGSHIRRIASGEKILNGAVGAHHIDYLDITPELPWVADKYIVWRNGYLDNFTEPMNLYYATQEYISFPYGGVYILLRSAKSVSDADKSGIAFYDANKVFISGSDYNRETNGLEYSRIFCPVGTAYIRLTCIKEENLDGVRLWYADYRVTPVCIGDGSITREKLIDGIISNEKLEDGCISRNKIADDAISVVQNESRAIPLELIFTPDLYIERASGGLRPYTPGTNVYFATEDYVPFPYGGCRCIVRASMTVAENDKSGLALYDKEKKFISGVKYDQKVSRVLSYTEFVCPENTAYIRMTMHTESLVEGARFWLADFDIAAGRIRNGAVLETKLADNAVAALKIQAEAVTTEKLQDGAVTAKKLADASVEETKLAAAVKQKLTLSYQGELGEEQSENPIATIRETPGLMSIFRHVGCIGDSLASGSVVYQNEDGSTSGVDMVSYSWGQFLARMTGNTYYNWSRGGLRCDTFLNSSMATECYDGNHLCEAYIIGLGQNEKNKSYPIGTVADIDMEDYSLNAETYYGNYGKIIQKIKEVQPKAKIFVLTDPLESVENAGYNDAVREIALQFENVYLADLYTYGTDLYSTGIMKTHKRGGHYNAVGYYYCGMVIATYIDWLIRKYPEEFREVEFIGTANSFYD